MYDVRGCSRWDESDRGSYLLHHQTRLRLNGAAQVGVVWRRADHRAVDSLELLRRRVALDMHREAELFVARLHGRVETQEPAQINVAFGLDAQFLEFDAFEGTTRAVGDDHAGVERGEQVF